MIKDTTFYEGNGIQYCRNVSLWPMAFAFIYIKGSLSHILHPYGEYKSPAPLLKYLIDSPGIYFI